MSKIAVGIMCKNESHIIERCLKSILPLADLVVITDTGSTDDTVLKAGLFLQKHNIKYKIYFEKFVDFSHNRNLVIQRVKETGEADYCFMIDADEEFRFSGDLKEIKQKLEHSVYEVLMTSGLISFWLPRLTSTKSNAKYCGVTHEYLNYGEESSSYAFDISIYQNTDSHRRQSNQKNSNDIELLEKALDSAPDDLKARYTFYLAQSYNAEGNKDKAWKYYLRRTTMGFWEEEVFYSYYMMGRIYENINTQLASKYYLLAYEKCPRRIESLMALKKLWDKEGYENLNKNMLEPLLKKIKHPGGGLFIEDYQYYIYGS